MTSERRAHAHPGQDGEGPAGQREQREEPQGLVAEGAVAVARRWPGTTRRPSRAAPGAPGATTGGPGWVRSTTSRARPKAPSTITRAATHWGSTATSTARPGGPARRPGRRPGLKGVDRWPRCPERRPAANWVSCIGS